MRAKRSNPDDVVRPAFHGSPRRCAPRDDRVHDNASQSGASLRPVGVAIARSHGAFGKTPVFRRAMATKHSRERRALFDPGLLPPGLDPGVARNDGDARQPSRSRRYGFTHLPLAFDDLTAASTKARPLTPSSMVGKFTDFAGFLPTRAALMASATSCRWWRSLRDSLRDVRAGCASRAPPLRRRLDRRG